MMTVEKTVVKKTSRTIDRTQLPFLLRLVDDKSSRVRAKVAHELRAFGSDLWHEVEDLDIALTPGQRALVEEILEDGRAGADARAAAHSGSKARGRSLHTDANREMNGPEANGHMVDDGYMGAEDTILQEAWLNWLDIEDEGERLEVAFCLLAQWQLGPEYVVRLETLLDELAVEFRLSGREVSPQELSEFLFAEKGLQGSQAEDYYNPLNSNLVYVIEWGRGIPISLASIFILTGKRLGLEIYGCNFPGHFLARAHMGQRDLLFDCFNEGRLLSESETAALRKAAPWAIETPASAVVIIARILRNLAVAFEQNDDVRKAQFMLTLLSQLERAAGP
jgi:regulator of sirC expression with transglutaminase-like and TPR domain